MTKIRNIYTSKQKVKIVIEGLSYPDGIQAYCRKRGIRDALFYKWKNQIQDKAENVFQRTNKKEKLKETHLQSIIDRKDKIISELVEENINLKKNTGHYQITNI
jgi:transposase-like protein